MLNVISDRWGELIWERRGVSHAYGKFVVVVMEDEGDVGARGGN
jgi:hypothetical protein